MRGHLGLLALAAISSLARAQNLVTNGGFEQGSTSPAGWARNSIPPDASVPVDIAIDKGVAHSGSASLKFVKTEQRFYPVATMNQNMGVPGSHTKVKVGMWVKASNVKKLTMGVIFMGGNAKGWGAYVGQSKDGDPPATHEWTHYGSVLAIPQGTTEIILTLEMYGPGTAWVDDVTAEYVSADTPLVAATKDSGAEAGVDPLADLKDVPNEELKAGNDPYKRYFLIGKHDGPGPYKLLVVMPGGPGDAEFNPFVRRIWKNAMPEGYLIAELVAPVWSEDQAQQLVWPTGRQKWATQKFSTEDFVEAVIKEVKGKVKIDEGKVFTLSWSSSGPAAYAVSLTSSQVKGSFVAMSVFKTDQLPPLIMAKGHTYYLFHSPDDALIPMSHPQAAQKQLTEKGAKVTLVTYPGGHGWRSDPFGNIRKGVEWLEANAGK